MHPVYECEHHVTSSGAILIGTAPADTAIVNAILKNGTGGSFHHWVKDDYDLTVTVLQNPHTFGGFGLTPNVIAQ